MSAVTLWKSTSHILCELEYYKNITIIKIIIIIVIDYSEWMNGPEGACWGSEGDLIAEQRALCAAFNPACTPFSASQLLHLWLHTPAGSLNYVRKPISNCFITITKPENGSKIK